VDYPYDSPGIEHYPQVISSFAASYIFTHHDFIASVIIPDYFIYSDHIGLHRNLSLSLSSPIYASQPRRSPLLVPSDTATRFMIVSALACLVLATPHTCLCPQLVAKYGKLGVAPRLHWLRQFLLRIDTSSMFASTVLPTSSLYTGF
jgi:hypothetical protein